MGRQTVVRVLVAAVLLGSGGCAHRATPIAAAAPIPVADCVTVAEQRAGGVQLTLANGEHADAVIVGSGSVGVVYANESDGDLCQWKPYADVLAAKGYRGLVFNYSADSSGDVVAGIKALRDRGVSKVLLVGASMGGTAVLVAAAQAQPPVAGVVSLSAPQSYGGMDAIAAVKAVTVPSLFIVAQFDEDGYAQDTQNLYDACVSKNKKLDIEPGVAHGVALLDPTMVQMIQAFLDSH